jgi:hypothetical protein
MPAGFLPNVIQRPRELRERHAAGEIVRNRGCVDQEMISPESLETKILEEAKLFTSAARVFSGDRAD